MNPSRAYLAAIAAAMPERTRAGGGPIVANDLQDPEVMARLGLPGQAAPAQAAAPAPAQPATAPAPFPGMMAPPGQAAPSPYTDEQKVAIARAGFTPEQAAAAGFKFADEPILTSGQRMRQAMAENAPQAEMAPAGPSSPPPRPPVTFLKGSGGIIPAREVEHRGPTLRAAQAQSNAMTEGAIDSIRERSQQMSAIEAEAAAGQVRQAYARQEGAELEAAARQSELQQRQQDFDASVKALSKASVDPNRFWASRTTGQKIAAGISVFFGGFLQGATGGANPGLEALNTQIDRDIKAQEFAYGATRDTASMKQTAFALAMQKYQNVDAARAMARAASLDAVQAQLAQVAAMWKGTEAGNKADIALAQLQKDKEQQIAQGIAFMPATQAPRMYLSPEGIPMTEAEAKAFYNTEREREFGREKIGLETAGKVLEEGAKAQATQAQQMAQNQVRLPTGEVVTAPTSERAKEIAEAAAAVNQSKMLIARAKQIRADSATGKPLSPSARAELEGIRSDLLTNYGVAHKLGALSDSDYKVAESATGGDLFSFLSATDHALDASQMRAEQGLAAKVSTLPNASGRARGEMPGSFTAHGKK